MAVVTPRLLVTTREQLAARQRLLRDGAAHVGWKLGMGDREGIDGYGLALGIGLRAGDRIITGSIVQVPVAVGDNLAAVIDGETAVTLQIA